MFKLLLGCQLVGNKVSSTLKVSTKMFEPRGDHVHPQLSHQPHSCDANEGARRVNQWLCISDTISGNKNSKYKTISAECCYYILEQILEKIKPLELRLNYQIDKLVKMATTGNGEIVYYYKSCIVFLCSFD